MTMTYGELKQAIQDYTENDETTFVNNIPLFIRLAEERILKSVQLNLFQKNQFGNMTTGNEYLAAPVDFLAPFSLSIDVSGDKEFLLFKDLDFVQTYNPDATTTGQPKYYTVDIHYLYRPTSLTAGADSGTSWLSINAELGLLYGSLCEAYTFMKGEPQLMQLYTQRFAEAIARLKDLGEAKETIDQYRYGPIRKART
jgi:hypothetical protein